VLYDDGFHSSYDSYNVINERKREGYFKAFWDFILDNKILFLFYLYSRAKNRIFFFYKVIYQIY